MKTAKGRHNLEYIKEQSKKFRLGYIDYRVHYNEGSMVVEILDIEAQEDGKPI